MDHHWVICQCKFLDNDTSFYLALHRFDDRTGAKGYGTLEEALRDPSLRQAIAPQAHIKFQTNGKRPLMADYIAPALKKQLTDYNLATNNCQHFAAFMLNVIVHASEYIGASQKQTTVTEYGEHIQSERIGGTRLNNSIDLPFRGWLIWKPDHAMNELVYRTIQRHNSGSRHTGSWKSFCA